MTGSDGGHNGMKDIMARTGMQNGKIARLRIGVGSKSMKTNARDFVLDKFSFEEQQCLKDVFELCAEV